ncbi:MAG: hypothetical protein ABIQ89_03135 [Candidatus Saccharimonadales bacterium]
MKAVILYHPKSAEARTVEEYVHDFAARNSKEIELLSLETREGAAMATIYDIVRYPSLMVLDGGGQLHKAWQGETMPLIDELAAYLVA